ncbi:MAG: dephospho-CoA kinase [Armatimonadetes bacterium CG07_land_8_20_14_0_80_40_9]|nr:MAG: dephospho-CoA kinase [Armatimonadetes bacterium CG07_land_8_20_14_0_80_40_9]
MIVGLTGGIASGKSTVAKMFEELGARVVDTDIIAREVVKVGSRAWREIVNLWGKGILNEDQTINRKRLGEIVFNSREDLKKLNEITHPEISKEVAEVIKKAKPEEVVIIVIPLLIEEGLQSLVEQVWVVTCSEGTQIRRIIEREDLSLPQARARLKSQMPLAEKIKYSDKIINADLPISETRKEVERIWELVEAGL